MSKSKFLSTFLSTFLSISHKSYYFEHFFEYFFEQISVEYFFEHFFEYFFELIFEAKMLMKPTSLAEEMIDIRQFLTETAHPAALLYLFTKPQSHYRKEMKTKVGGGKQRPRSSKVEAQMKEKAEQEARWKILRREKWRKK